MAHLGQGVCRRRRPSSGHYGTTCKNDYLWVHTGSVAIRVRSCVNNERERELLNAVALGHEAGIAFVALQPKHDVKQ